MRWFRLHSEITRDPKIRKLTDKEFRWWINLLAIAGENDGYIPPLDDLKHMLNSRLDYCTTYVLRMLKMGLIVQLGDGYTPHNWEKRQYKSDTSTDRVKKHREKRNVSVTPPDTDSDSDSDTDKETVPKGTGKKRRKPEVTLPENFGVEIAWEPLLEKYPDLDLNTELEKFKNHAAQNERRCRDWMAALRNWLINAETRRIEYIERFGKKQHSEHDVLDALYESVKDEIGDGMAGAGDGGKGEYSPTNANGGNKGNPPGADSGTGGKNKATRPKGLRGPDKATAGFCEDVRASGAGNEIGGSDIPGSTEGFTSGPPPRSNQRDDKTSQISRPAETRGYTGEGGGKTICQDDGAVLGSKDDPFWARKMIP